MIYRYAFIGGCASAVNFVSDLGLRKLGFEYRFAIILAWFLSVTFAYFGNKIIVFKTDTDHKLKLYVKFLSSRGVSLAMEEGLTFFFLSIIGLGALVVKIISQIFIIVINYIIGIKLFKVEEEPA